MTPFWLLVMGIGGIWFIVSGRAAAILEALMSAPSQAASQAPLISPQSYYAPPDPANPGQPLPPVGGSQQYGPGYRVDSPPTITARQIDSVLRARNSPAAGIGEALVRMGRQYNIDPAVALAFFIHESSAGTDGPARQTRSWGNIRCTDGYTCIDGWRAYPSWEAGAADWYRLIRQTYMDRWGLRTLGEIIPRYAPASDGNNPTRYIQAVVDMIRGWAQSI